MACEHPGVRVVQDRRLDSAAKELAGLTHEVLVERVLRRDEDGEPVPSTAGPSPLLPEGGGGAGESDGDDGVEEPDVDPELQGVGRRDSEELALGQAALDLPP